MTWPLWVDEEEETSEATLLPTPGKCKGGGANGCVMTVRGMEEAKGAWA